MALMLLVIIGVNKYVLSISQPHIYALSSQLEGYDVGLVLGASVYNNKTPSVILEDRLKGAYQAYQSGVINKIIVSGDNSTRHYNEPIVMKKYLLELGVDVDDIYEDFAGFDTYDSLYRAKYIFGIEKVVLFTQEFHLKRALYIAHGLGMQAEGMSTDYHEYLYIDSYNRREIFSRVKAFLEIEIFDAKPKFGGDEIKIISDEEIQQVKKVLLDKE